MQKSKSPKIGTAILGAGGAGRSIMGKDIVEHSSLFELKGFHDPVPAAIEQAKKLYPSANYYPNYEALLADDSVELVLIATGPHRVHPAQAIEALRAGKHCVVIKPLCYTVAEADAMIEAARAAKRLVTCLQNVRWSIDFLLAMETLQKRDFGRLLHVALSPGGWHGPSDILYNFGSHYIDQLLLLAGSYPVEVSATFWNPEETDPDKQGGYLMHMRMSNGALATLSALPPSLNASSRRDLGTRFHIVGTKEHYVGWRVDQLVDLMREHAYLANEKGQVPYYTYNKPSFLEYRWKIPTYWESLAASIRDGAPLTIPAEHTRQIAKIFEAATRSSQTGKTVTLFDDGPKPFPAFSVLGNTEPTWVNNFPF
jgi:predicted dehydrogenase